MNQQQETLIFPSSLPPGFDQEDVDFFQQLQREETLIDIPQSVITEKKQNDVMKQNENQQKIKPILVTASTQPHKVRLDTVKGLVGVVRQAMFHHKCGRTDLSIPILENVVTVALSLFSSTPLKFRLMLIKDVFVPARHYIALGFLDEKMYLRAAESFENELQILYRVLPSEEFSRSSSVASCLEQLIKTHQLLLEKENALLEHEQELEQKDEQKDTQQQARLEKINDYQVKLERVRHGKTLLTLTI